MSKATHSVYLISKKAKNSRVRLGLLKDKGFFEIKNNFKMTDEELLKS